MFYLVHDWKKNIFLRYVIEVHPGIYLTVYFSLERISERLRYLDIDNAVTFL